MPIAPYSYTANIHGMDLVPANIKLSGAELELVMADMRDIRLQDALKPNGTLLKLSDTTQSTCQFGHVVNFCEAKGRKSDSSSSYNPLFRLTTVDLLFLNY